MERLKYESLWLVRLELADELVRRVAFEGLRGFSPVIIEAAPTAPAITPARDIGSGVVEVELKDVRVKIGAGAPSAVIIATLRALRS